MKILSRLCSSSNCTQRHFRFVVLTAGFMFIVSIQHTLAGVPMQNIRAYLDTTVPKKMKLHNVPGAAMAIVDSHGRKLLAGYGFADIEKKLPVDPSRTVFRCLSVTKLFTVISVLQLAERGLLDLDTDVNRYLKDFKIPGDFPKNITLRHLLTHTAGFEDRLIGIGSPAGFPYPSLKDYLMRSMPQRIMPPGAMISYSNHGIALAGLIVQYVSGEEFKQYTQKNILNPLGMGNSSFFMKKKLTDMMAVGYRHKKGRFLAVTGDSLEKIAPAGGLISTAGDMAAFISMNLNGGRYNGARILLDTSVRAIHSTQFKHHPMLNGIALDFFENRINGLRGLYHYGEWTGYSAVLYLIPEKNLGIFIALNGSSIPLLDELIRDFHMKFFPARIDRPGKKAFKVADLDSYTGLYRTVRYSRNTLEKLITLFLQFRIRTHGKDSLRMSLPIEDGRESYWKASGPLLFSREGGDDVLYFKTDRRGSATHVFSGTDAYERIPWFETAYIQAALYLFFILFSASVAIGLPIFIKRRQSSSENGNILNRLPVYYMVSVVGGAWLNLLGLVGIMVTVSLSNPLVLSGTARTIITALLTMEVVVVFLTLIQGFYLMKIWKNIVEKFGWEWAMPLVTAFFVLNALFLSHWNLIGLGI